MGGAPRVRRGQPQTAADRAADRRAPRRGSPRSTVVCDGYVWRRSAEGVAEGRRGTAAERRGTAAVPPRSFAERRGASHRGGPRFPPRFCDGTAALWRRFGDGVRRFWRRLARLTADRRGPDRGATVAAATLECRRASPNTGEISTAARRPDRFGANLHGAGFTFTRGQRKKERAETIRATSNHGGFKIPPAGLQWGAAVRDGRRRFWLLATTSTS